MNNEAPQPTMVNAFDMTTLETLPPDVAGVIGRRNATLGPGYRLFYQRPVEFVRGQGAHLYDAEGTDYLDVYNNVPSVGHAHPRVVEAVHAQMQMLNTHTRYLQRPLVDYAEDLLSTFPSELSRVTFTCTGSEANDLAFRIAKHETGREGVIVTETAYHGITDRVSSFSPSLGARSPLGPNVRVIQAPDALRAESTDDQSFIEIMRARTVAAIDDLHRHGYGVAAFYADAVFSSDGIFTDPVGFLAPMVDEIHNAGGLYVADEVQSGFGRTGEQWWGFQRHKVTPDLVTLGKPMGNGLPIAGLVLREGVGTRFGTDIRYFNTFGGNPVSIAAAQAVLNVIRDEALRERAHRLGNLLRAEIAAMCAGSHRVAQVRGVGQFTGVDLVTDRRTMQPCQQLATTIVNTLRDHHVLISATGAAGNVLKIRPPLAFNDEDAGRFLDVFQVAVRPLL